MLVGQSLECGGEGVVAVPAGILHGGAAIVGDVDEDGAAVVGVGSAVNESKPDHAVDKRSRGRHADALALCQLTHPDRAVEHQRRKRRGLCRAHLSHRGTSPQGQVETRQRGPQLAGQIVVGVTLKNIT